MDNLGGIKYSRYPPLRILALTVRHLSVEEYGC